LRIQYVRNIFGKSIYIMSCLNLLGQCHHSSGCAGYESYKGDNSKDDST
jgi:hypothetical protein